MEYNIIVIVVFIFMFLVMSIWIITIYQILISIKFESATNRLFINTISSICLFFLTYINRLIITSNCWVTSKTLCLTEYH